MKKNHKKELDTLNDLYRKLNKKTFIDYTIDKKVELLEATGLQLFNGREYKDMYGENEVSTFSIKNEKIYIGNILKKQIKPIQSLEEVEQLIRGNTKKCYGEYIEIEDREFYKENTGIKAIYRNAFYEMKKS